MRQAVVVSTARTPVGRAHRGSLVAERPDDLLAHVVRAALEPLPAAARDEVVDVIAGCAFPQDRQGMNVGRRGALLAGLPVKVPGTTVNRFCASSLQAIRMAFHAIRAGEGDVFVAAGVESVSQVNGYPGPEDKHPDLTGAPGAVADAYVPMGITAENVAVRFDVDRADMDRFAQRSHERAVTAQRSGALDREIVPYTREDGTVVDRDDGPRPESSLKRLAQLQPAFLPDGRVTAGNACPLNDGAAAVVVMEEETARRNRVEPRARILASAVTGLEPELMGMGPVEAVREALARAGMGIEVVDVVELNEAFAAQVLPVCEQLGIDPYGSKLNPHGGAIALGHPFGMTGARMMGALLNDLERCDGEVGVETMCVGGGQGMAMVVQRVA